jgi:PPE-repeat protein
LLASLVASNILGQNTPAIATTEAHYAEMWAQDAAAMYGYAGSSAAASTLTPFAAPPATTTVSQAAGTGTSAPLSQLVTSVPATLQGLASPATSTSAGSGLQGLLDMLTGNSTSTTGLSGLFNDLFSSSGLGLNANIWNTIFSSGFYMPSNTLGAFTSLFGGAAAAGDAAGAAGDAAGAAGGIGGAVAAPAAGLSELGGLGGGVSAALGRGTAIGALAVPPNWTALAPTVSPLPGLSGAALGGMPPEPPPAVAAGIPGMPFANAAGNRFGAATPRYGLRPTVMAHPPAAG